MFDFGLLPPEINSTNMYSGAGASSLITAAQAWDALGDDLESVAAEEASIMSRIADAWQGPSATDMLAAVHPYITWMTTSSAQAHQTAAAAMSAVTAFETAFTATVPPPEVFANRIQLAELIATNIFGQNTPAIMATEAQYTEMWAQDVAAMYNYQAQSAAATSALPQTTAAPSTTSGADPAAATATAAPAESLSDIISALLGGGTPGTGGVSGFLAGLSNSATGFGPNANLWNTIFTGGTNPATLAPLMGQMLMSQQSNELTAEGNRISYQLMLDDEKQTSGAKPGIVNPAEAPSFPPAPRNNTHPSFGGTGRANGVGFLSVPPNWDKAVQEVRLTSAASPITPPPLGGASPTMLPTPIAAVNAPSKPRKQGEEILVSVRFVPNKGL